MNDAEIVKLMEEIDDAFIALKTILETGDVKCKDALIHRLELISYNLKRALTTV